jgi:hypothetical protein
MRALMTVTTSWPRGLQLRISERLYRRAGRS